MLVLSTNCLTADHLLPLTVLFSLPCSYVLTFWFNVNPNKPNGFLTEDYGTIYNNPITFTLERMVVSRKCHNRFIEMLFDKNKPIKTATQFQFDSVVQTSFPCSSPRNNDEGSEGSNHRSSEIMP
jgi:hypothetical protein